MIKAIKKHFKKKDLRNRIEFAKSRMQECSEVGDDNGLIMWSKFWSDYCGEKVELK